jgi:hypothetical protein
MIGGGAAQMGAVRIKKRSNSPTSDETERGTIGPEYGQLLAECGAGSNPAEARGEVEARVEFSSSRASSRVSSHAMPAMRAADAPNPRR